MCLNKRIIPLLVLATLLVSGIGLANITPAHAQSAYNFQNRFVVAGPTRGICCGGMGGGSLSTGIGIPDGGILFGNLTMVDVANNTANTFTFSTQVTVNGTGQVPAISPVVTFNPSSAS